MKSILYGTLLFGLYNFSECQNFGWIRQNERVNQLGSNPMFISSNAREIQGSPINLSGKTRDDIFSLPNSYTNRLTSDGSLIMPNDSLQRIPVFSAPSSLQSSLNGSPFNTQIHER
jgi:hypothetical protein